MNKRILPILVLVFPCMLQAQVSILKTDMPASGQTIYRSSALVPAGLDYQATGTNYVWDFSQLEEAGKDTSDYVSVSSTNFAYQLYFNNPFSPNYRADFAVKAPDFPIPSAAGISITDVYNYYKNNNTEYSMVGFGATVNSIPTSVRNDSIDYIYRFPMNYGNTDHCVSRFSISVPSVGGISERKQRWNEVDGWGLLKLPNDAVEHQVLRVKTHLIQVDTISIASFGVSFPVETESYEYKWIGKGFSEPLLQINTSLGFGGGETVSGIRYKYIPPNTAGIAEPGKSMLSLLGNPVQDFLRFYSSPCQYSIYDASGALRMQGNFSGTGVRELSVQALASGMYLIITNHAGKISRASFIKQQ
jgi:hypothetical protein